MPSDLELLALQAETLFVHDAAEQLVAVNEPDAPEAPRFFWGRTAQGSLCRFRYNVPEAVRERLTALVAAEPSTPIHEPPRQLGALKAVLHEDSAVQRVWLGPAYRFSDDELPNNIFLDDVCLDDVVRPPGVVNLTAANAELLTGEFAWLRPVLTLKQPCVAVVRDEQAVSVCHSSRTSVYAAEAGLETLPAFRGRGYAAAVVLGWAAAVREAGRTPLYSTSWDNVASQAVARKLGLSRYATDIHIT